MAIHLASRGCAILGGSQFIGESGERGSERHGGGEDTQTSQLYLEEYIPIK